MHKEYNNDNCNNKIIYYAAVVQNSNAPHNSIMLFVSVAEFKIRINLKTRTVDWALDPS